MTASQVIYQGFADGEYGLYDGSLVGYSIYRQRMLYKGFWTGTNVTRAIDGSLVPMPQPKAKAASGLTGPVGFFDIGYDGTIRVVWGQVANGDIYWADATASTYTFSKIGTIALSSSLGVLGAVTSGSRTYCVAGSGVYKIDHAAGPPATVTQLHADTVGTIGSVAAICVYGERLLYSNGNRLWFSAAGDFTSWPAANYIDVGLSDAPISAIVNLRSSIAIAKGTGNDTAWWILSGTPGVNARLRSASELAGGIGPAVSLRNGTVGFLAGYGASVGTGFHTVYPAVFNGSAASGVRYLGGVTPGYSTPHPLVGAGDWILYGSTGSQGLVFRSGAWSYFHWTSSGSSIPATIAADPIADVLILAKDATHFYEWQAYWDRPAYTTDSLGVPPETATFTLPAWRMFGGDQVSVREVHVDFTSHPTGDTINNSITVAVNAVDRIDENPETTRTAEAWSQAPPAAQTSKRKTFRFGPDYAGGFELVLSNLRGVAIHRITAIIDEKPGP